MTDSEMPVGGTTNDGTAAPALFDDLKNNSAPVAGMTEPAPTNPAPTKPKPFSIKGQSQTGWIGQEKRRLKKLEGIVQRGMSTFIEVGNALTEIRDRKLYRLSPFGGQGSTFEEYAFRKFGFSRAHAYRHIKTANVQAVLSPIWRQTSRRRQNSE